MILAGLFGSKLLVVGKYTILPTILFIYKNLLRIKLRFKYLNLSRFNYLRFIKKYVPSAIIIIIIITSTTHNIFAKDYTADEYAKKSLLSNLITLSGEEVGSELIEEIRPAVLEANISSYLEDQGNLQEIVVATPFEETDIINEADILPDASSLVLNRPEDSDLSTVTASGERTEAITYVVQPGDVLGKIAEKFNVTVNTILWENSLNWSSTIKPGQKLTILPNSGVNHEVAKGDTVSAIAKKYQTEADKIIDGNKLADASDIQIGDLLFIPDGVKTTKVVSSYRPQPTYAPTTPAPDSGAKLLWPVLSHRITQYYHWGHHGLDIGDKTGNPIYTAEAGRVERVGWTRGYGYNIIINHGNGLKTLYAHASKLLVAKGESVSRGQTIALVGSTGWSTGPHVHMEVIVTGIQPKHLDYIT